jgi:hypothetical protein
MKKIEYLIKKAEEADKTFNKVLDSLMLRLLKKNASDASQEMKRHVFEEAYKAFKKSYLPEVHGVAFIAEYVKLCVAVGYSLGYDEEQLKADRKGAKKPIWTGRSLKKVLQYIISELDLRADVNVAGRLRKIRCGNFYKDEEFFVGDLDRYDLEFRKAVGDAVVSGTGDVAELDIQAQQLKLNAVRLSCILSEQDLSKILDGDLLVEGGYVILWRKIISLLECIFLDKVIAKSLKDSADLFTIGQSLPEKCFVVLPSKKNGAKKRFVCSAVVNNKKTTVTLKKNLETY